MSRNCPRCRRPNGEAAPRCIYCGAVLEPPAADAVEAEPEEVWPASYAIIVTSDGARLPPEVFEEATGRPGGWLAHGTPVPVAITTDPDEASAFHQLLVTAGVPAALVAAERLGKTPALLARRATFSEDGMELVAADGRRVAFTMKDLLLMVTATVVDPENVDESMKLRPRSMIGQFVPQAAGGITGRMTVLDLYARGTRPVRIVGERFDYGLLGNERQPLSIDNFPLLLEALQARAPRARVDASFRWLDPAFEGGGYSRDSEARRLEIYGRRLFQAMVG